MIEAPSIATAAGGATRVLQSETTGLALLLGPLDPFARAALHLVYVQGLTQAEVAARLRLPIAEVGAAVSRGLRQLADSIVPRRGEPLAVTDRASFT